MIFGLSKFRLIFGVVIVMGAVGAYYYHKSVAAEVDLYKERYEETLRANKSLDEALTRMNDSIADMQRRNADLASRLSDAEKTMIENLEVFDGHDLEKLAHERPGLIEKRMNDATDRVLDDLRSLTGGM